MSDTTLENQSQSRFVVSIVASILVGLTLLFAGVGKVVGLGQMPGQTEFLDKLLPGFILTPAVAYFIGYVFIPYVLPFLEIILGIILVIGLWPRLMAIFCLPLTLGFIANNVWMISQGLDEYPACDCFGIWEEIFGIVSPLQSLCIDIGLFVLALIIIFLCPGTFFSSQLWMNKVKRKAPR